MFFNFLPWLAFFYSWSFPIHLCPFTDVLRKIFGSLTRKVGFFTEGNEENEDFRSAQRTKPLFSLLSSVRKDSAIGAVRLLSKKRRHACESVTADCELRLSS